MFVKILHTASYWLLIVLIIALVVYGVLLLCAGYRQYEFTVMKVYIDHTGTFGDSQSLTLFAADGDTIIRPEPVTINGEYHVGDKISLWYQPSDNTVARYVMLRVIISFVCAAAAGIYVAWVALEKKRKGAVTAKNKSVVK